MQCHAWPTSCPKGIENGRPVHLVHNSGKYMQITTLAQASFFCGELCSMLVKIIMPVQNQQHLVIHLALWSIANNMHNKNLPRNPGRNQHGNIYIYRKTTICGRSSDVPVAWTHTFVRCHWRFSFSTLRVQPTCSSSKSLRAKASSCVEKSLQFYLFKKKHKTKCEVYI